MKLVDKTFSSPYFIFIKQGFKINDESLLQKLNLQNYKLVCNEEERKNEEHGKRYLFLTEDQSWTHLMDDWLYTLWSKKDVRERVKELSLHFDIFCCSMGDIDNSYDFIYFQNGKTTREYCYSEGRVVRNYGSKMLNEEIVLKEKDTVKKVFSIARSLGINLDHDLEKIRCYGRLEEESEKFLFNEDEY